MISGPVVVQVLEGENAVLKNREIMGATNPNDAAAGTIRKDFAESIEANSVHGSDSLENAAIEIALLLAELKLSVNRFSHQFIDRDGSLGYPVLTLRKKNNEV